MRGLYSLITLGLLCTNVSFGFNNIVEDKISQQTTKIHEVKRSLNINSIESEFFSEHSIVFVYSSKCRYCHMFSPTLRSYVDEKGLNVRAISLDNRSIKDFPNIENATDELVNAAYGDMPHGTPALFIVNEKSNAIYPALFGNSSYEDLSQRMSSLINKIKQFERRV